MIQARKEFILGRATGKKVKEAGVSLPQDPEVSTIHGKVRPSIPRMTPAFSHYPIHMHTTPATPHPPHPNKPDNPFTYTHHTPTPQHLKQIECREGKVFFEDLGSTNGTLVEGRKISEAPLHDGARIQVGSTVITYRDV